jgi:hypothetical protein
VSDELRSAYRCGPPSRRCCRLPGTATPGKRCALIAAPMHGYVRTGVNGACNTDGPCSNRNAEHSLVGASRCPRRTPIGLTPEQRGEPFPPGRAYEVERGPARRAGVGARGKQGPDQRRRPAPQDRVVQRRPAGTVGGADVQPGGHEPVQDSQPAAGREQPRQQVSEVPSSYEGGPLIDQLHMGLCADDVCHIHSTWPTTGYARSPNAATPCSKARSGPYATSVPAPGESAGSLPQPLSCCTSTTHAQRNSVR